MNALMIANTQIRRDAAGRYCLNDLHQASGGEAKNQPPRWLRLMQTQDLIQELLETGDRYPEMGSGLDQDLQPVIAIEGGLGQGTYAVKELVYAYAMWISAKFQLHVIRAYDAMVTRSSDDQPMVPSSPQHRADVVIAATRGFSALLRAGRSLGMDRVRAIGAANNATLRATGIDLVSELDAADMLERPPSSAALVSVTDQLQNAIEPWLDGRSTVTMDEVIRGALNGNPANKELQTRLGIALRRLGWLAHRNSKGGVRSRTWVAPRTGENGDA